MMVVRKMVCHEKTLQCCQRSTLHQSINSSKLRQDLKNTKRLRIVLKTIGRRHSKASSVKLTTVIHLQGVCFYSFLRSKSQKKTNSVAFSYVYLQFCQVFLIFQRKTSKFFDMNTYFRSQISGKRKSD